MLLCQYQHHDKHVYTHVHMLKQLTHSSLKANMDIPHKHQKEDENNLMVQCIMDRRLLFVLIEDKQTIQKFYILSGSGEDLYPLYCNLGSWTFSFAKPKISRWFLVANNDV
jgi:hypothetical protein